jgi:hypothetical protein
VQFDEPRRRRVPGVLGLLGALVGGVLEAQTTFQRPAAGESLVPGSEVEVAWTLPAAAHEGDEMELLLSIDGEEVFSVRVSEELEPDRRRFLWRVPSLATTRARLALRAGEGGERELERILGVSEEFSILVSPVAEPEPLHRGTWEIWTRDAFRPSPARNPRRSLSEPKEEIFSPTSPLEAADPPETGLSESSAERFETTRPARRHSHARAAGPSSFFRAPIPLRE